MDAVWVCGFSGRAVSAGVLGVTASKIRRKGGNGMPIIIAAIATPLAHFAEGAILGASVYLVSRGAKSSLKTSK